jgi:hypothetical protein
MMIVSALIAAVCILGTTGASEAKGKKAAAPERKALCMTELGGPVCGTRGGMKFTYANSCYAMQDGAKVSGNRACRGKK